MPNSDVEADVALAALGTTQLNTSRYPDSVIRQNPHSWWEAGARRAGAPIRNGDTTKGCRSPTRIALPKHDLCTNRGGCERKSGRRARCRS